MRGSYTSFMTYKQDDDPEPRSRDTILISLRGDVEPGRECLHDGRRRVVVFDMKGGEVVRTISVACADLDLPPGDFLPPLRSVRGIGQRVRHEAKQRMA